MEIDIEKIRSNLDSLTSVNGVKYLNYSELTVTYHYKLLTVWNRIYNGSWLILQELDKESPVELNEDQRKLLIWWFKQ